MASFPGRCTITQGDSSLTEFQTKAVTGLGQAPTWLVTYFPELAIPGTEEVPMTLQLETSGAVLTLGEKTEGDEGTQIYLMPPQTPPTKSQLWTMEDLIATKRYPALLYTRIQSVQDTQLSAAAGIFNIALPRLYLNVAGVTKDQLMEDRKWKFDYLIDE